ncbi:MAG TPA: hypothetical protein VGE18_01165 [Candidatus Paceibacterota bacterium]
MHVNKKIVLFLVAENNSGKTFLADHLIKVIANASHYSVRKKIQDMFEGDTKQKITNDRTHLQRYSESMKAEYGPRIFIHHTVAAFNRSAFDVAVIESVRAPGEAEWIQSREFEKEFPNIIPLLIGVTAPLRQRLRRFLSPRPDNIASSLTPEEFRRHEEIANHGKELHEENIGVTMLYTNFIVTNVDGKVHESVEKIREALSELCSPA